MCSPPSCPALTRRQEGLGGSGGSGGSWKTCFFPGSCTRPRCPMAERAGQSSRSARSSPWTRPAFPERPLGTLLERGRLRASRPSRLQYLPRRASFFCVRPTKLGIIGLGAIGGSLARQAKQAGVPAVLGWSPQPAERVAAARQGAIDDAPARAADVARAVDLLVLAAPPAANLELLETLRPNLPAGALVTDVGSVKRAIVARAEGLGLGARFAGGHPLAGTHEAGF